MSQQQEFYQHVKARHSFSEARPELEPEQRDLTGDWLLIDKIDGIDYYTPNDEEWGSILAISEEHKLAHKTDFFEMDDMACEAPYDDYKQVVHQGKIMCKFEAE